jgi:5-oxopent-3-ene-1,2,5-tricarboxylate decarboxylase / 2-hydroxyhepta-2,4-diene-1,7-dioate isomerase
VNGADAAPQASVDAAPYRCTGTVYGTLLNHREALAALGDAVRQPPYKAPPNAPVLYVKPRNTLAADGARVVVPAGVDELEIGASLAMVFGRTACRVDESRALEFLDGYTIAADLSVPHASLYRPAVRQRARDGFCPLGPRIAPRRSIAAPDALDVRVRIDGVLVQQTSSAGMLRPAARLIADVTEFMTLRAGDVLLLGVAPGAPRARAGQSAAIEIDGIGCLRMHFVAEPPEGA